eukprot:m.160469 g.160469  ORF g.160469 m.160469 type:complete len:105 (-) comp16361_c0_seq6:66-380(-)
MITKQKGGEGNGGVCNLIDGEESITLDYQPTILSSCAACTDGPASSLRLNSCSTGMTMTAPMPGSRSTSYWDPKTIQHILLGPEDHTAHPTGLRGMEPVACEGG